MPTYAATNVMAHPMNPTVDGQQWFVLINQDSRRMMSTHELQAEVRAGTLARETLVWRAGMSDWQSISSIGELGMSNTRPTVPRARAAGWDAPLIPFPDPDAAGGYAAGGYPAGGYAAGGYDAYEARSRAQSPQLILELIATGAAVLLIVAITSYTLFAGGAFQPGSAAAAGGARESGAQAKASEH